MIVIAIIGILAAIAIPQYAIYTTRAKLSEGLIAVSHKKNSVAEAYLNNGMAGVAALARNTNTAPTADKQSKFVKSSNIDAATGAIIILLADDNESSLPDDAKGKTLIFKPISEIPIYLQPYPEGKWTGHAPRQPIPLQPNADLQICRKVLCRRNTPLRNANNLLTNIF